MCGEVAVFGPLLGIFAPREPRELVLMRVFSDVLTTALKSLLEHSVRVHRPQSLHMDSRSACMVPPDSCWLAPLLPWFLLTHHLQQILPVTHLCAQAIFQLQDLHLCLRSLPSTHNVPSINSQEIISQTPADGYLSLAPSAFRGVKPPSVSQ